MIRIYLCYRKNPRKPRRIDRELLFSTLTFCLYLRESVVVDSSVVVLNIDVADPDVELDGIHVVNAYAPTDEKKVETTFLL